MLDEETVSDYKIGADVNATEVDAEPEPDVVKGADVAITSFKKKK